MADEPAKAPRRKRLKGKALGELRTGMKVLEKAVNCLNKERDRILDEHNIFKDQVNWNSGIIFDADLKIEDRVPIDRLTKDEIKEQRPLVAEVDSKTSEVGDLIWRLCDKLGCIPGDLSTSTGEITGTPVDHVDPYDETPQAEVKTPSPDAADAPGPVPLSMDEARLP